MTPVVFGICKGAIPRSTRLFPYTPIVKGTCLALGSAALLPVAQQALKRLSSTSKELWQAYRLIPASVPLHYRKIGLGGAALVLAVCMIRAFYPYLHVFLSSSYPLSFVLRFRNWTPHSGTIIAGAVVFVGQKLICICFGIQVTHSGIYMSRDSLSPLERLRVRFFGSKNQIWRPNLPPQTQVQASQPNPLPQTTTQVQQPSSPLPQTQAQTSQPSSPLPQTQIQGWDSIPIETVRYIFLLVMNETENFQDFFTLGQVCLDWRTHLLHSDCLIPRPPYRHFLARAFRCQKFDPIEVTAFFQKYLLKGHQGEGLRLPLRFLDCTLEDSLTARQLTYIFTCFPKASVDSITLRLDPEDDVAEVARFLNIYLEPGRKLYCLTIKAEQSRNPQEAALYGKLLLKEAFEKRRSFEIGFDHRYPPCQGPKKGYTAQVLKLLPLLKGKVAFLRIDLRRDKDDKSLDPVQIVRLFHPRFSSSMPVLSVGRLDLKHENELNLQYPYDKDRKTINALIKCNVSSIHSEPDAGQWLIDDTLLVEDNPEPSRELEMLYASFMF